TVAKGGRKREDLLLARRQQLLHGEFGRGVKIKIAAGEIAPRQLGLEGMQMPFVAGRDLQAAGIDLRESLSVEPGADGVLDPSAGGQKRPAVSVAARVPPRGGAIFSFIHR